jgi:hypothetical protein
LASTSVFRKRSISSMNAIEGTQQDQGGDGGFSIAMTACAAKFSSSAICLSENGRTSRRLAEI